MNSIFVDMNYEVNLTSILFISSDVEYISKIKENPLRNVNISYFNESKFQLLTNTINSFDIIVFDNSSYDLEKFIQTFKLTQSYEINIPIIVLEDVISDNLSIYKYSNTYMVLEKATNIRNTLANIELCVNYTNNNKKQQFEDGFYYDTNRELLFRGKELIKLTKTERNLIKILAENANMLVTYEEISQYVWEGKSFSIFSLRNVVKHIREKTSESFIKNSSNRGYIINTI